MNELLVLLLKNLCQSAKYLQIQTLIAAEQSPQMARVHSNGVITDGQICRLSTIGSDLRLSGKCRINLSSMRGTNTMHRVVMYFIAAAVVAAVAWMILPAAQAEESVTKQVPAHQPGQPIPSGGESDRKKMQSAMSAAPSSLSQHATIKKWNGTILRQGKPGNVWTCLPDIPNNGGIDPWCIDQSWQNMLAALTAGEKPTYDKIGIAYMLMGDGEVSNISPDGTKDQGQWVAGLKAHLMLLVPDHSMFDYLPTEPNGGPWIMWKDTPYAHVMIPIDSYPNP